MNPKLTNNCLQPPEPHSEDAYERQEKILDWVRANFNPNEVFGHVILEQWALENGFIMPCI